MNIQELEHKHKEIIGESDLYYPEYLLEGLNKEKIFEEYEKEENLVAKEATKLSVEFAIEQLGSIIYNTRHTSTHDMTRDIMAKIQELKQYLDE